MRGWIKKSYDLGIIFNADEAPITLLLRKWSAAKRNCQERLVNCLLGLDRRSGTFIEFLLVG
jgi:hypothetical protein